MTEGKVIFEDDNNENISIKYPCFELKDIVEYYFEVKTPENSIRPFSIIALPNLNIVASVYLSTKSQSFKVHRTRGIEDVSGNKIGGSLTEAITIIQAPGTHELCIKFKPGVLYPFLHKQIAGLVDNHIPLEKYIDAKIISELKSLRSFDDRVQYVEDFLISYLDGYTIGYKLNTVSKAIYYAQNNLNYKLELVAKNIGTSNSTLYRYCKEVIGISPKQCLKIIRFKAALKNYRLSRSVNLYEELGYTDFSHFVKEAKDLADKPPSKL